MAVAPIEFRLFVVSDTLPSNRALVHLREVMSGMPEDRWHLDIVDVLSDPEQADRDRVIAVPTLIRVRPLPERRITGDLSDLDRLRRILGLDEEASGDPTSSSPTA